MRKTSKLISFAAAAALLLSGCGMGTPAPAVSESETTTSAAETTTAEATAATTTASTTTTVTTTDEPEPVPISIKPGEHHDQRRLYSNIYDERRFVGLWNDGGSSRDHFGYWLDPGTYTESSGIIMADVSAADIRLRNSSGAFSEKLNNDVADRVTYKLWRDSDKFVSAYDVSMKAPVITFSLDPEGKLSYVTDLTLGYTISETVTVNAFVCDSEDGLSILIDPCYMYGLPMLSNSDTMYIFGEDKVSSDSLLVMGHTVEGLALDTADYAYAKLTLADLDVTYTKSTGYANTCTVTDIGIIDTFTDITDYNISDSEAIVSSADKDPEMQKIYDAIMFSKDEIYTDDTFGILLLDLDLDGVPEVLSTSVENSGKDFAKWKCETRIYRADGGKLRYIDSLYPIFSNGFGDTMVIGLTELPDGRKAWHLTKRIENPANEARDIDNDYMYTLDGDTVNEYPLFTEIMELKEGSDPEQWDSYTYTYCYLGEPMEIKETQLTYTEEELAENWIDYPSTNYEWNGITSTFGKSFVFGYAREDYGKNKVSEVFSLLSDWIGDTGNGYMRAEKRYDISPREFAHRMAYLVDEWFLGGGNITEHFYAFTGAMAKPVIYLYSEEQTDVSVKVNFPLGGEFTCTYPDYGDGWNVTAMPDGTLYDKNGDEYYCLYWEGRSRDVMSSNKGFCVKGDDTAEFLREKLMYIGLTAREANEFIIYWLPKMQDNPYNVITLHTDDYARSVPLTVSPTPDTQIRVFMTYYSSDTPVDIPEQELPHYERNGFTLVEWGGSEE